MFTAKQKSQIESVRKQSFNEIELRCKFPQEYFDSVELPAKYKDSVTLICGSYRRESFYEGTKKLRSVDCEKQKILSIDINPFVKLSVANEVKSSYDSKLKETKLVRFKRRYEKKIGPYTVHYTQIFKLLDVSRAKEYLSLLFGSSADHFQSWELEVEIKTLDLIEAAYIDILKTWESGFIQLFYDKLLRSLYFLMQRQNKDNSLKSLLNNPVMLGKPELRLIDLKAYSVADKSDGERCLLYFKNNKVYEILVKQFALIGETSTSEEYLIDCEKICNKSVKTKIHAEYLCFDVASLTDLSYELRLKELERLIKTIKLCNDSSVSLKKIRSIKSGREIADCYEARYPYEIDGLIFTETKGDYWARVYKWKPAELLTFDLLIVPDSGSNYILMCGIKASELSNIAEFPPNYQALIKPLKAKTYVPAPFSTKFYPQAYKFQSKEKLELSIGEFFFKNGRFELMRLREDKTKMISKGQYGNNFFILQSMIEELQDPATLDDLVSNASSVKEKITNSASKKVVLFEGSSDSYFNKTKPIEYKAPTKFNSFVKFTLLAALTNSDYVIDLASGKGQDLFVYHGIGVKKVTFIEPDLKAFIELETRVKNLGQKAWYRFTEVPRKKMICECLNKSYEEIRGNINVSGADIVCNFALHYLLSDRIDYVTFADFCKGARSVTLTFFDREVLRFFLPYKNKKYYVEQLAGGKIIVKHHFSDELYEENLIDTELLISCMQKKGFKLARHDSFGRWLDCFKREDPKTASFLTEQDKEYCSFYQYLVFLAK